MTTIDPEMIHDFQLMSKHVTDHFTATYGKSMSLVFVLKVEIDDVKSGTIVATENTDLPDVVKALGLACMTIEDMAQKAVGESIGGDTQEAPIPHAPPSATKH